MEIGMLWYDDSPIALKDRVLQAAGYYNEKYGRKPNLCLVHPDMLQTEEGKANGVVIRKGKGVMPGHFWIGVDEAPSKANGGRKATQKAEVSTAAAQVSNSISSLKEPKAKADSSRAPQAQAKTGAKAKSAAKGSGSKPKSAKASTTSKANSKSKAKSTTKAKSKSSKSAANQTSTKKSKAAPKSKSSQTSTKSKTAAKKRSPVVLKKKSTKRVEKSK